MSDNVLPAPQSLEEQQAQARMLGIAGGNGLAGFLSNILPSPQSHGLQWLVPGMASGAYGFLNDIARAVGAGGNIEAQLAGNPTQLPNVSGAFDAVQLPGAEAAKQLNQGSYELGKSIVGPPTPQNPAEQEMGDIAGGVGQSMSWLPEVAVAKLPSALSTAAHVMAPATGNVVPAMAVAGVGMPGLFAARDAVAANQPLDLTNPIDPNLVPEAPSTSPHTVADSLPSGPIDLTHPLTSDHEYETNLTMGAVALTAVGLVAALAGGKQALRFIDEATLNLRNTRYADAVAAYSANPVAEITSRTGQAPIPPDATHNRFMTEIVNQNNPLDQAAQVMAPNKTVADALVAKNGLLNNDEAAMKRIQYIAESGQDPQTGVTFPSLQKHQDVTLTNMSDEERQHYNIARYAADEQDTRMINVRKAATAGSLTFDPVTGEPNNVRVNFPNTSDAELRQAVATARAFPAVNYALDEINAIHRGLMDVAEARGFIGASDRARILNDHANYLASTDTSGIILAPFEARNTEPYSGLNNIPVPAWSVDIQHFEGLLRAMEMNDFKLNNIQSIKQWQFSDPSNPRIVVENRDQMGEFVHGRDTITVRNNGNLQHYQVNNIPLRLALTRTPVVTQGVLNTMSLIKNITVSTVTGPVSALTGHVFPVLNSLRTGLVGAALRPPDVAYGVLDKAALALTGGRRNFPLGDPTGIAMLPYRAAQDLDAVVAQSLSKLLNQQSQNWMNTFMRSLFSNQRVDWMSARLQKAYEMSFLRERRAAGVTGIAGYTEGSLNGMQKPAFQLPGEKAPVGSIASPLTDMAPRLHYAGQVGGLKPMYVRVRDLYKEVLRAVSEAGQSQMWAANSKYVKQGKMSSDELAFLTRTFAGDPGMHGASEGMQQWARMTQYNNIAIQDIASMFKAIREHPISAIGGLIGTLGTAALGSAFSAMIHGQDAIDHYERVLSDPQAANGFRFWMPGYPADQPIMLPLPQRFRWMTAGLNQLVLDGLVYWQRHPDVQLGEHVWDLFSDIFSDHITQSTAQRTLVGAEASTPPVLPSVADAASLIVTGRTPNITPLSLYNAANGPPSEGLWQTLSREGNSSLRVPGQMAGSDNVSGSVAGNTMQKAMSAIFGIFATTVYDMAHSFNAGEHTPERLWTTVHDTMAQNFHDIAPTANHMLWNQSEKAALSNPIIERTQSKLNALAPLVNWKASELLQGQYSRMGAPVGLQAPGANQLAMPTDPTMQKLYVAAGQLSEFLSRKAIPTANDIRKQIASLENSDLPPVVVRDLRNNMAAELTKRMEAIGGIIRDTEIAMERQVGAPVAIERIKWKEGPQQFK